MRIPAAIILSAGLSSRMGRFKPLLPLGSGTVLSSCIELFKTNGVDNIIVVTGKRADEVAKAAEASGARPVHNPEFERGMYSSVLAGVRALEPEIDAFFMLPVDIPLVRPETVARLSSAYGESRGPVLYPRFNGERGHPPVISRAVVPDILAHDGSGGLRTVLERWEPQAADLDVADFGTVHDLDHPQDYELAVDRFGTSYPDDAECRQLWDLYETPDNNIAHCRAVARVARALCERLNERGVILDGRLVRGAALTHDIGKGGRHHEAVGADRLDSHGFHAAADIAREHFDLSLPSNQPITEKEVVFLADKMVRGVSFIPLRGRYLDKLEIHGHEPGARDAITGRLERASALLERFDSELGVSAETLAREALK